MPLRDHFRPPVSKHSSWEGFHGYWPAAIVQSLGSRLPDRYVAEPRVHLGNAFEIDISTFEEHQELDSPPQSHGSDNGDVAIATWSPPAPSLAVDTEIPEQYQYEVLIFDVERNRHLVAAVEIISPANKDRPDSRQMLIAKCQSLLQKGVCVSLVDLVTIRHFNLYSELLAVLDRKDPKFSPDPPPIYAATCRTRVVNGKRRLETWAHALAVGEPLPTLPLWLTDELSISLELEATYEEACRVLRIA
jgi:hypothetical protein